MAWPEPIFHVFALGSSVLNLHHSAIWGDWERMEWLHDLHSDDMLVLGSVSLISGLIFGILARLGYAGMQTRKTS